MPSVRGHCLLDLLQQQAARENLTDTGLAKKLDISRSYLTSLRYGQREVSGMRKDTLRRCAAYLGVPMITVLIAAEVVSPDDFFSPDYEARDADLGRALHYIATDGRWGPLLPQWQAWPSELKRLVVLLYEQATGRNLLGANPRLNALICGTSKEQAR